MKVKLITGPRSWQPQHTNISKIFLRAFEGKTQFMIRSVHNDKTDLINRKPSSASLSINAEELQFGHVRRLLFQTFRKLMICILQKTREDAKRRENVRHISLSCRASGFSLLFYFFFGVFQKRKKNNGWLILARLELFSRVRLSYRRTNPPNILPS